MLKVRGALLVIGFAVAGGCAPRPDSDRVRAIQHGTHTEMDEPGPGELAVALAAFEHRTTSGSAQERVDAVYALHTYVSKHAMVADRLIRMLQTDKDPALRGAAARTLALAANGSDVTLQEKTAAALIAALDDKGQFPGDLPSCSPPASVRYEAAVGLKSFGRLAGPAVSKLGDLVADKDAIDVEARFAAAETLAALGPDAAGAVPQLIKVFAEPRRPRTPADRQLSLRLKVIEVFGAMREAGGGAVPELTKLLTPDQPERIYAAYALGKMGSAAEPAIPELLAQTDDKDFSHFTSAMAELGDLMRPYIVADLESNEPRRQVRALHTLMFMKEEGAFAVPQIRQSIKSSEPIVRDNSIAAVMVVGRAGETAIPDLESALADPVPRIRYLAAQAIVERMPEHAAARDSLVAMLDDVEMCQHAMTGLWYVGKHGANATAKLEALAQHDDPFLRTRAAVTLWIVHPESKIAPTVVREMLQHKDADVRSSAASLVGRAGASAEPILDILRTLLDDEDVQTWAQTSVEQIESALR